MPVAFSVVSLIYFGTSLAYSFGIKRLAVADTICFASLFTMRVLAGSVILGDQSRSGYYSSHVLLFQLGTCEALCRAS